jgi:hypothetical protein
MRWMELLANNSLKRLFAISLATSIICNGTISYLMSISGTSLPEYFKVMFSLNVPLIRGYIDGLQGPGVKTWFAILYGVDYVFFTALGLMISSASILIHRNKKAFGVMSKLGKSFALVGILVIAVDFFESGLAVYMFSSASTYPYWIVVPHSALFILAIIVDGIACLFLLASLLTSVIRVTRNYD